MAGIILGMWFFGIPLILLVLVGICLYRYICAKRKNKAEPETISRGEIKERKIMLIATSVIFGIVAAIEVGFIALMFQAVAYM